MSYIIIRNFEESEDELRDAVADSMKNLFVMEDGSSDEADDGTGGGAVSAADPPQIQPQVEDSGAGAAGSMGVISSEPGEHDHQSECSGESQTDKTS